MDPALLTHDEGVSEGGGDKRRGQGWEGGRLCLEERDGDVAAGGGKKKKKSWSPMHRWPYTF